MSKNIKMLKKLLVPEEPANQGAWFSHRHRLQEFWIDWIQVKKSPW